MAASASGLVLPLAWQGQLSGTAGWGTRERRGSSRNTCRLGSAAALSEQRVGLWTGLGSGGRSMGPCWVGAVHASLQAAEEETPIVSRHTHALGVTPASDSFQTQSPPTLWPQPWPQRADSERRVGHSLTMYPDDPAARASSSRSIPFRLRLPRLHVALPLHTRPDIPTFGVTRKELLLVLGAGGLVLLAVLNKILFKLAIASMPDQPFVLANICTMGYLLLYGTLVYQRWRQGAVSSAMLHYPKTKFVCIGALEAAGAMLGLFAAGNVPGTVLPILSQGYLVWQLALSAVFLRRRYSVGQLVGVAVSLAGIATVVTSAHAGPSLQSDGASLRFPLLYLLSASFSAGASLIKERLFQEAPRVLPDGQGMDLFVVNLLGSSFQFGFLLLLLPLVASARGVPPPALPAHLAAGAGCFLGGTGPGGLACIGAPLLPLVYIVTNLTFNVAQLALLKATTAVVPSIALTLAVPLSVATFTLPLPLLGPPHALPPSFVSGTFVLLSGLVLYLMAGKKQQQQQQQEKQRQQQPSPLPQPPPTVSLQPHFERAVAVPMREGRTPRVRVTSKRWR